jgi:hypothetical protein
VPVFGDGAVAGVFHGGWSAEGTFRIHPWEIAHRVERASPLMTAGAMSSKPDAH